MAYTQQDVDGINKRIDALMAAKFEMEAALRYSADFSAAGRVRRERLAQDLLDGEAAIPRPARQ